MPPRRVGALNEYSPSKITLQIAELQAIYYVAASIFILFTSLVMGTEMSLDLIFGWDALRGDTTTGWMMGFVWLSCAFVLFVYPSLSFSSLYLLSSLPYLVDLDKTMANKRTE